MRAWLHRRVVHMWQRRGPVARALLPLALVHAAWRAVAGWAYRIGLARPARVGVPVVVIGNLYAGGTGKTPLVIEVVRALRARGWHPGVVSRGYGGDTRQPRLVGPYSRADECGDEPLVIYAAAAVPVAVGRDRVLAARLLLGAHPACDILVADDGLQHRRLGRELEIAVIHSLGVGNGWLLPAGPLRDPPLRLEGVDAVVFHGITPAVRVYSPFYFLETSLAEAYPLAAPAQRIGLDALAREQRAARWRVLAACGIGVPERFFAMLREHGLVIDELALPDHAALDAERLARHAYDRVLMTEKDAVKCRTDGALVHDARLWVVPLRAQIDSGLIDLIESRIARPGTKSELEAQRGSKTA
ncbi:MAG TPA: tetraacyldisaccharide 4'-kinase [Burkholderiaceae bacterium]